MESDLITKWKNSTKKLTLGVSFATVLLLLYNAAVLLPPISEGGIQSGNMLFVLGFLIIIMALCYFSIVNYCRGLSRFAVNFEEGGKRALWMIRWSFILTLAGIVMQMFVFRVVAVDTLTFGEILLGNVLWLIATVVGIVGFLSLATAQGMTHDGRKGAAHMAWVLVVIFVGACLVSLILQSQSAVRVLLKVAAVAVNLFGTCFFYKEWKRILTPADGAAHDPDDATLPKEDGEA